MNNENLKKYKNIHKGKRVFLIGNGPSLAQTDLDLIKDEYSIAMMFGHLYITTLD